MPLIPRCHATAAALLALFAVSLSAPRLEAQSAYQSEVRFVNHTPHRRVQWSLATVPFPQGVWTAGKSFRVQGANSELVPFGQRWPDGSVRFAQLACKVDLAPYEDREYRVVEGAPNLPAFRKSAWVQRWQNDFDFEVVVCLEDGRIRSTHFEGGWLIRDSEVRQTRRFQKRIDGTNLVCDLWINYFHDQDFAPFELRVTSSKADSPVFEEKFQWIAILPSAAYPIVRGTARQGYAQVTLRDPVADNPVVLLGETSFFDGQAYEWFGDLLFVDPGNRPADTAARVSTLSACVHESLWGVATNWRSSGAWGPFGHLPEPPVWITDGGLESEAHERQKFREWFLTPGEAWEDRPKGLVAAAGRAGTQYDFGVGKLADTFSTASSGRVEEARYIAGEEAHRPVHHREADGTMVQAWRHPMWVASNGVTHWSPSVSPDRLGKPYPPMSGRDHSHGWTGKDHEHWSSLTLCSAYLLTCSDSLRMELDNEAELFLSSHTIPSMRANSASNNTGTGRAIGRTMLSQSWLVLLTDRDDVSWRLQRRVIESVIPQYRGLQEGGAVRPLFVRNPDPRMITSGEFWVPWEEATAVMGLEATARVTGSVEAHNVAVQAARSLCMHGWRADLDNSRIAYAVRFMDGGSALPASAWSDTVYVVYPGAAFNIWALPATDLAIRFAQEAGDWTWLQRAKELRHATAALRHEPKYGVKGWDEYAEWDGAR